jgi:hypothetical protein
MTRRLLQTVALTAATCALAAQVMAQGASTGTPTVSREVLAILLEGPDGLRGRSFDLSVGALAPGFPADLVPPGADVRASAVEAQSAATTVVAAAPRFSLADQGRFEQRLAAAGWIDPDRPRGFVGPSTSPTLTLCRGDQFAKVTYIPDATGGSFIRAMVERDAARACVVRPEMTDTVVPVPTLTIPEGARSGRAAIGGTPDAMYSSIRLETAHSVEQVNAHYAAQLTSAGWTLASAAAGDRSMAVSRLRATGRGGRAVTGLLIVAAIEGTSQIDVMLRVVQAQAGPAPASIIR